MAGMLLPPGFRFHPTDVELIMFYLKRKVMGKKFHFKAISELNIYKFSPWDLPDKSCLRSKDLEWYFFCPRERKYASGARMNRSTENGYWKTTGKDRPVLYNEKEVGMAKTLVFHLGHAPHGQRTDWVIHEYRNVDKQLAEAGIVQDAYVLCKVFHKNGPGPKNGAQYGAPFKEEEWDDDVLDCYETFPSGGVSDAAPAALHLPENPSSSVVTSTGATETTSIWPLAEPGPSSIGPSADVVLPDVLDDDILHLLEPFTEDGALPSDQIDNNEKIDNNNHESNVGTLSCLDGNEVYNGLGDLGSWHTLGDTGFSFPTFLEAGHVPSPMLFPDSFLELDDLEIPLNSSAEDNERVHVPAGNPSGDSEQLYFGPNHFGADPYFSSLSQLPLLPDGSNNIDGFSRVLQVNGDGTNANQGSSAAYCLAFTQSNESRRIDQNNDRDGFFNF